MKLIFFCAFAVACASAASVQAPVQASFLSERIVNGHEAQKGEAPFMISLHHWGEHFCGGVLIDEHWILTAAHCLENPYISAYAGLHNWKNTSEGQYRFIGGSRFQISHEKFEGGVGPYDIGLIYVQYPFVLNSRSSRDFEDGDGLVGTIGLSSNKYSVRGKGKLYGWGRMYYWEKPDLLQTLDVDVIDYEECKANLPVNSKIHPTNICTFTPNEFDGACNGDSGGPLLQVGPGGQRELIGLVSWGYSPCDATRYPSVYTWVQPHLDWIKETMANFVP